MEILVWIFASIFVLNVVLVFLAGFLLEFRRRRQHREIRRLEALWRAPTLIAVPSGARRGERFQDPDEPIWATFERPILSGLLRKASVALAVASLVTATVAALIDPGAEDGRISAGAASDRPTIDRDGSQFMDPDDNTVTPGPPDIGGDGEDASPGGAPSGGSPPEPRPGAGGTIAVSLAAEPVSSGSIHVDWDDVPGATGYSVDRSILPDGDWAEITTETVSEYTDTGLAAATTYYYRVSAELPEGPAPASDVVSATTADAAPVAPELLTVSASEAFTISLTWTDVADETGYRVERIAEGETEWTLLATTGEGVVTYDDGALVPGQTYRYRVVAVGIGGESTPSNELEATATGDGGIVPDGQDPTPSPATPSVESPSPGPPSDDPAEG